MFKCGEDKLCQTRDENLLMWNVKDGVNIPENTLRWSTNQTILKMFCKKQ